jgi:NAD(P)-dependent dehydrogenase (short-subunit alcohol dehydrogenase family)
MVITHSHGKVLVVLGATGTQGGAVLRHFAKHHHDFELKGITRKPNSAASEALKAISVQMLQADLHDTASLRRAFDGATHIFANIDSVELIMSTIQDPSALAPGQTPFTHGAKLEEQLGVNLISAAAETPTSERIIWSTLPSPTKCSQGKYTSVPHFDVKATIADLFLANPILGPKVYFLNIGLYFDMPLRNPALYPITKVFKPPSTVAWLNIY